VKNTSMLKVLFLSIVLSSCGLIDKFKTPEEPTDSKEAEMSVDTNETAVASTEADATDDLFSKTLEESSQTTSTATDAPNNVATNEELKSLEDEFSAVAPGGAKVKESSIAVTPTQTNETIKQEAPVLVEEALPEIKTEVEPAIASSAGQIKTYKVKRGETLMQIAFAIYGDISKWKELKAMNSDKVNSNKGLKANLELKYKAPAQPFVWNPNGKPYLIKNGETLGTISNAVYSTPKKWKSIWENNKPMIKNPNVIYAGFTLYYTNGGMANYVQPKAEQPKQEIVGRELARAAEEAEEVIVDQRKVTETVAPAPMLEAAPVAPVVAAPETAQITPNDEDQVDEAIQTLSATKRTAVKNAVEKVSGFGELKEGEIDLINNVSVPHEQEIAPDIDEEFQTL
jgi:nucleoid-associated protein YgaU